MGASCKGNIVKGKDESFPGMKAGTNCRLRCNLIGIVPSLYFKVTFLPSLSSQSASMKMEDEVFIGGFPFSPSHESEHSALMQCSRNRKGACNY